jgi:hypothetical protein
MTAGEIVLEGLDGFTGTVAEKDWPVVGGAVTVHCDTPPVGPWARRIRYFKAAQRCTLQWVLASGEVRTATEYRRDPPIVAVGDTRTLRYIGRTYEARCTQAEPAACVAVEYTIKSGASRRRELYYIGDLFGYFIPRANGGALIRLKDEPT